MKTVVAFIFIASASYAQTTIKWEPKEENPLNLPTDDQGEIRYQEVVPVPKLTPGTVIKRARTWASKTYPSANDIVQQLDTTQGIMVIRGIYKMKQGSSLGHRLVVDAKDGRYRVTIDKLAYEYEVTTPARLKREVPVHPYGVDADDYYTMIQTILSQTAGAGLVSFKKQAVKAADHPERLLIETKKAMESLLTSLKKAIAFDGDW